MRSSVIPEDVHQLARDVGWEVLVADDGAYTVGVPGRKTVKVYTSMTSVRNALARREKTLREEQAAIEAAQARRDKEKNQRGTRQAEALRQARGGYLVLEDLDLEWALDKHPLPAVRLCRITPGDARALLAVDRDNYRRLNNDRVNLYERAMLAGQWKITHQGIAVGSDGVLLDGQHRLNSCVRADAPFTSLVVVGIDPVVIVDVDESLPRTAADLLRRAGYVKNTASMATAIRLVLAYETPNPTAALRGGYSAADIAAYAAAHPEMGTDVRRGLSLVTSRRCEDELSARLSPVACAAGLHILTKLMPEEHKDAAHKFLAGLATGFHNRCVDLEEPLLLADSDPRLRTRQWFDALGVGGPGGRRRYVPAAVHLALIFTTWNLMVRGQRPRSLRYSLVEPRFPEPEPVSDQLLDAIR